MIFIQEEVVLPLLVQASLHVCLPWPKGFSGTISSEFWPFWLNCQSHWFIGLFACMLCASALNEVFLCNMSIMSLWLLRINVIYLVVETKVCLANFTAWMKPTNLAWKSTHFDCFSKWSKAKCELFVKHTFAAVILC